MTAEPGVHTLYNSSNLCIKKQSFFHVKRPGSTVSLAIFPFLFKFIRIRSMFYRTYCKKFHRTPISTERRNRFCGGYAW